MGTWSKVAPLTAREREVAALISSGLTNRQIAGRLGISERTVGAHVQNILNKLGMNNRAQIAVWSASLSSVRVSATRQPPDVPIETRVNMPAATTAPKSAAARRRMLTIVGVGLVAIFLVTADSGAGPSAATGVASAVRGALVYEAKLSGDGEGFTVRTVVGDPSASAIRFDNGIVEYAVVKPGGNTGNRLAMAPRARYFAEIEMAVVPGSDVQFWLTLTADATNHIQHLIGIGTRAEAFQLGYFLEPELELLGPQVTVPGLQLGRRFTISTLVDPPHYQVYLDGRTVIDLHHEAIMVYPVPGFAFFGDGIGTVRLTVVRVYSLN